jgi:hypothetical protein
MASIKMIDENEAEGKVKIIFDEIPLKTDYPR